MQNQMISAISTAAGVGGVAIIRVSGDGVQALLQKMFIPIGKISTQDFKPYQMYPGKIVGDGFYDFGLAVLFKAPRSFTGEDVVEFHCHGGIQISRGILKQTFKLGARPADRGEFTKRAFLNGKLSLASAEGMIDMINAESMAEVRAGAGLYQEKLTNEVKKIQSQLTDILAGISADIDYPEEEIERDELSHTNLSLEGIADSLKSLIATYSGGKKIKQGVTVALCGKPNTGKSSLLNTLLGYDKAIVSSVAGTTRDVVEGSIELDGVRFNLYDTAGIREQAGEIESIGIDMAKKTVQSADLVIFVSEGECDQEEQLIWQQVKDCQVVKVLNKCDIKPMQEGYDLCISARTGQGIDGLKQLMLQKTMGGLSLEKTFIIEERHFEALNRAYASILSAINAIGIYPLDIISVDINEAWSILGEITGETANEEIINTVFAKFCVGK